MTTAQLTIWTTGAEPSEHQAGLEPADEINAWLKSQGLPFEVRIDGARRCRHHQREAIFAHGAPCKLCRLAGAELQVEHDQAGLELVADAEGGG